MSCVQASIIQKFYIQKKWDVHHVQRVAVEAFVRKIKQVPPYPVVRTTEPAVRVAVIK